MMVQPRPGGRQHRSNEGHRPTTAAGAGSRLPQVLPPLLLLSFLALIIGDSWSEALSFKEPLVAYRVEKAYGLLGDERYQGAREHFEAILAANPSDTAAREGLTWTYLAMGDTENASREADALLAVNPDDGARQDQWLRLISQIPARRSEAIEGYRRRVAAAAKNLELRRHLAELLSWTEDRAAEAVDEYRWILRIAPEDPAIRLGLARTLSWIGRHDEAIPLFDGLIEENPLDAEALFGRAQVAAWTGDFCTAEALLRRAAEVNPEDGRVGALLQEVTPAASLVDRGYRGTSLVLTAGVLAFCLIIGTFSRRMTVKSYWALILVTALLIGLTLMRFYLDI